MLVDCQDNKKVFFLNISSYLSKAPNIMRNIPIQIGHYFFGSETFQENLVQNFSA